MTKAETTTDDVKSLSISALLLKMGEKLSSEEDKEAINLLMETVRDLDIGKQTVGNLL